MPAQGRIVVAADREPGRPSIATDRLIAAGQAELIPAAKHTDDRSLTCPTVGQVHDLSSDALKRLEPGKRRQVPVLMVALRPLFANQGFLARVSRFAGVELKAEASGVKAPDTNLGVAQVREQRDLNIFPDANVDPLTAVEDSVDAGGRGSMGPD
jgi:hypothetical protein